MAKHLGYRIRDSFEKNDDTRIFQYMELLRTTMIDYVTNVRRTATTQLLLIATFELIVNSKGAEVVIGAFHITRDSVVLIFVPALISFLYLQVMSDSVKIDDLSYAFSQTFQLWSLRAAKNDLHDLLSPPQLPFWSPANNTIRSENRTTRDKVNWYMSTAFAAIFLVSVLVYEVQAYYVLYPKHVNSTPAWTISLCVTVLCFLCGTIGFLADGPRQGHPS